MTAPFITLHENNTGKRITCRADAILAIHAVELDDTIPIELDGHTVVYMAGAAFLVAETHDQILQLIKEAVQ